MKYSKCPIYETLEELKILMNQNASTDDFPKIKALYLLKARQVNSLTNLAVLLGVNRITIHRWLNRYKQGGIQRLIRNQYRNGRRRKIPPDALQELKYKLTKTDSGFKTYCDVQDWLQEKYGLTVSYNVVYGTIRYGLNLHI